MRSIPHQLGGVERGHLDRLDRVESRLDRQSDPLVEMALTEQQVRVDVVGAQHE
jgi:hypothetical protein